MNSVDLLNTALQKSGSIDEWSLYAYGDFLSTLLKKPIFPIEFIITSQDGFTYFRGEMFRPNYETDTLYLTNDKYLRIIFPEGVAEILNVEIHPVYDPDTTYSCDWNWGIVSGEDIAYIDIKIDDNEAEASPINVCIEYMHGR